MSDTKKLEILEAIRQTAKKNGGKPLGQTKFTKETGINTYDRMKYWARWSDALKEAGFVPNTLRKAYDDEFIIKKMIGLIRKLEGKFPTKGDIFTSRTTDPELPDPKTLFETKKQKREIARKIFEWCKGKEGYQDISKICELILVQTFEAGSPDDFKIIDIGEVYLFKSGRYYKIGRTNDTVRRGKEIRIQLPERTDLIHSIKTDDPSGVEAYWHRRFESRRMNGEWFDLKPADVKAFKKWKRIV